MESDYKNEEWVTVFETRSHMAEVEAETIRGLLESSGIESWIVRENVPEIPTGKIRVRVLASSAADAEALLRQAANENADGSPPDDEL